MNAANFRYFCLLCLLIYCTLRFRRTFVRCSTISLQYIHYVFYVRYFIVSAPVSFKILLITCFWVTFELSNPTQIQYIDT